MHLTCQLFNEFIKQLNLKQNILKQCQSTRILRSVGEEKNAGLSPKTDNLSQLIFHHYKSISYVSPFRDSENTLCRKMQTIAMAI